MALDLVEASRREHPFTALQLVIWLAGEARICDPDSLPGEGGGRVVIDSATYNVLDGLIIEAYGKTYRLDIRAFELQPCEVFALRTKQRNDDAVILANYKRDSYDESKIYGDA